jgi:hypothetical protein
MFPAGVSTKIVIGISMVLDRARVELAAISVRPGGADRRQDGHGGAALFDGGAMVAVFDSVKDLARDTAVEGDLVRAGALGSVVAILLSAGTAGGGAPRSAAASSSSSFSFSSLSLAAVCSGLDALANLTTAPAHAAAAHELGALPYVCRCLEDGLARAAAAAPTTMTGAVVEVGPEGALTQRLLEGAVSVVRNLSAAPHDLRPLVVAHGVVGSLVNLVTTYGLDTDVCADAIAALLNVSTHDLSDAALRDNGVAPVLLECVGDCVAGIELQAFQTEKSAPAAASAAAPDDDDNEQTRDRIHAATLALRTARNMCASEPGSQFFSNRAALNILSRAQKIALSSTFMGSTSSLAKKQRAASLVLVLQSVTEVLENVAIFADADVCSDLLSLGAVASLTETIGRGSSDAKSSAADALASLILVDERVSEAIKTGAGGALLYSMIEMRAREREKEEEEEEESEEGDESSYEEEEEESEEEEEESEEEEEEESEVEEEVIKRAASPRPRRAPPPAALDSTPVRPRPAAAFGRSARPSSPDRL